MLGAGIWSGLRAAADRCGRCKKPISLALLLHETASNDNGAPAVACLPSGLLVASHCDGVATC